MKWDGEQRRATDIGSRGAIEILLDMEKRQVSNQEQLKYMSERVDLHGKKYLELVKQIDENYDVIKKIYLGDGDKKGVSERINNLEDSEKKRNKYTNAAWIVIIGLAASSIWDFFFKHSK